MRRRNFALEPGRAVSSPCRCQRSGAGLAKNSLSPGEDGCYSTQQIVESIYGALHLEKIRTQRELTKKLELENRKTAASLLDRDALSQGFARIADAFVSRIMAANELPRSLREDLTDSNCK
jgi:hypothetical protein